MAAIIEQFRDDYEIDVQELNLLDQPEIAAYYEIWSTPAVIINDELAFTGRVKEQQLREKLAAATQTDA